MLDYTTDLTTLTYKELNTQRDLFASGIRITNKKDGAEVERLDEIKGEIAARQAKSHTFRGANEQHRGFDRVQTKLPDSTITVNVAENGYLDGKSGAYIEWGTDAAGTNGGDLIVERDGSAWFTFQESSRLFTMDAKGIRIYDGDMERPEALIVDMAHAEYFDNDRGFNIGPVVVDRIFKDAITAAADIVSEHGEASEFDRGVYNLLASMFGVQDVFTSDRMDEIETLVRSIKPIVPA